MPQRELLVVLDDALSALNEAEIMLQELGHYEAFVNSNVYQRALERLFQIVGESLFQARKMQPLLPITDLQKIIGLRHVITHDYYRVSAERLWIIATSNLPLLKTEIDHCIREENERMFGTSNPTLDK